MMRILILYSFLCAELVFSMHTTDDFHKDAAQRLFAVDGDKDSLRAKLAEHFGNAENYREVAAITTVPHAITDLPETIDFLERGLGTKRGKNPQLPSGFHDEEGIVLFATSGLDVMAERLAFLAQHPDWWLRTNRFIALVSQHPHRADLLDREYLSDLPKIFYKDYDKGSLVGQRVLEVIDRHLTSIPLAAFTHKDGMVLVLDILACVDEKIEMIKSKWEFYSLPNAQTEALIGGFFSSEESNRPVTFVCTPAGTNSVKQIIAKMAATRKVDFAISGDLALDDELALHLTTPVMHVNNLLFNLYNRIKNG